MCLLNGSVKKLWVRLGLWEGWRSALEKEVLSELLEKRGLIRESGRRQNETSQACREGLMYNSSATPRAGGVWVSEQPLGIHTQTPKGLCLVATEKTGKEKGLLWLLGALRSLLSVICAPWALMVSNWLLPSHV